VTVRRGLLVESREPKNFRRTSPSGNLLFLVSCSSSCSDALSFPFLDPTDPSWSILRLALNVLTLGWPYEDVW
jgi:hypothetical protein